MSSAIQVVLIAGIFLVSVFIARNPRHPVAWIVPAVGIGFFSILAVQSPGRPWFPMLMIVLAIVGLTRYVRSASA